MSHTPQERVDAIWQRFAMEDNSGTDKVREALEAAIRDAVAEEREACARAADLYTGPTDRICLRIAADIRSRDGKTPNPWRGGRTA